MDQNFQSVGETQNTPQKKAWYKKWWVILIGIFIVFGIIGSGGEDKSSSPSQDNATNQEERVAEKTPEAPKTPEVTVTSTVLAKAYKENEVAADQKYKDKLIEISGKITGVDNGTFDNEIIVKLSDGEFDFSGPMCYMKPEEYDKVVNYKKGQSVTLIGTGNSATIGSPMLKDCMIK